jgi:hypothetical protein
MIDLSNPAVRKFVRLWLAILAASCAGMVVVVLAVLWATSGFHGLGLGPVTAVALIAGAIGATALCVVLMGLLFYSDSSGIDEAVRDANTNR